MGLFKTIILQDVKKYVGKATLISIILRDGDD
jgi:hypothetical protein